MTKIKKVAILTSGGDAPGMNPAIRAAMRCAASKGCEVVGVERGYHGLIYGSFVTFNVHDVDVMVHRGGTILKSARSDEFRTPEGRQKAVEQIQKAGIDGVIVIGGDGSFQGAQHLHRLGIPVIGIPGTIDNDIAGTDYSIGFDTAVNTVVEAVNKIRDTASSHERISVVEVMGRRAGYIALNSGLAAGAEAILIPEMPVDMTALSRRLQRAYKIGKAHSIVIVAEGVHDVPGLEDDNSGASIAFRIAERITRLTSYETRVTVLGHLQRGGSPTAADRILASRLGCAAVELLLQGESGRMVGIQNDKIVNLTFQEALEGEKQIDRELYTLADLLADM